MSRISQSSQEARLFLSIFVSILLFVFVVAVLLGIDYCRMKSKEKKSEENAVLVQNTAEDERGLAQEDVTEGDAMASGEQYAYEPNEDILFRAGSVDEIYARLGMTVAKYNEKIPYGYRAMSDEYGFSLLAQDGCTNQYYEDSAGMLALDSFGYVRWLYRNSLGYTPEELLGDFSYRNLSNEVAVDTLAIGDLCMTAKSDTDVWYGVVCGFDEEGHAIISMCDNLSNPKFLYGSCHLAYIKSEHDAILGTYPAVDFRYFFRLYEFYENGGVLR